MKLPRLFRRTAEDSAAVSYVPDGQRVYAIGDIHGRLDLLDHLLATIESDDANRGFAETTLILLGDLVDRGPQSRGVIERAMELARSARRVRFISGNHEEIFLRSIDGDRKAVALFASIGGLETMTSYGVAADEFLQGDFGDLTALIRCKVPAEHRAFLASFEDFIEIGDYLFVHAGIRPGTPIEQQRTSDMRWIRNEFLSYSGDHGTIVVHGHSIREEIDERPNRIGIDTGAYRTDKLTALALEGNRRWFLSTG